MVESQGLEPSSSESTTCSESLGSDFKSNGGRRKASSLGSIPRRFRHFFSSTYGESPARGGTTRAASWRCWVRSWLRIARESGANADQVGNESRPGLGKSRTWRPPDFEEGLPGSVRLTAIARGTWLFAAMPAVAEYPGALDLCRSLLSAPIRRCTVAPNVAPSEVSLGSPSGRYLELRVVETWAAAGRAVARFSLPSCDQRGAAPPRVLVETRNVRPLDTSRPFTSAPLVARHSPPSQAKGRPSGGVLPLPCQEGVTGRIGSPLGGIRIGLPADYDLRVAKRTTWPDIEKRVRQQVA